MSWDSEGLQMNSSSFIFSQQPQLRGRRLQSLQGTTDEFKILSSKHKAIMCGSRLSKLIRQCLRIAVAVLFIMSLSFLHPLFPPFPFPVFPLMPFQFPHLPLEAGSLWSSEIVWEWRCKLSQCKRGLRLSRSRNFPKSILVYIFALKSDVWWQKFQWFSCVEVEFNVPTTRHNRGRFGGLSSQPITWLARYSWESTDQILCSLKSKRKS